MPLQYTPAVDLSDNPYHEPTFRFYDHALLEALRVQDADAEAFFRLLALCHTVMSENNDGG